MKFTPEHLVRIDSMNEVEAKIFIVFLEMEIIRHRQDIINDQALLNRAILKIGEVKKCCYISQALIPSGTPPSMLDGKLRQLINY